MPATLNLECTVDARGRVTVPKAVREGLGLKTGNRVTFSIDQHNRVDIERATEVDGDPVVARFLEFLARDVSNNPEASTIPLSKELASRIAALVGDVDIDLDAEIDGQVAL